MTALDPDHLAAIAAGVVERAVGSEHVEVAVSHSRSTSCRVYGGALESFTRAENQGIGVRVVVEGRQGFASAGTLDPAVVHQLLDDARQNARFTESDPFAGVAEPDGVEAVAVDLWRPGVSKVTETERIATALELEKSVVAYDGITGVRTATYGDSEGAVALASTSGITAKTLASSASLGVAALAADGERTQTAYGFDAAREPADLDIGRAIKRAAERALAMRGASKPQSATVDLVLDPDLAATVIGVAAGTLTGDRVLRGRSPFADRLGEQVAAESLSFVDDPTNPDSLGADSHDGEGLATRRIDLVSGGRLEAFLHDSYTGRRSESGSTGSAVRAARGLPHPGVQALNVAPGDGGSLEDLIAGVELGVFAFSLAGLHSGVNPISGDLSVGVEGRMIRNGSLAEPISGATVASTIQRLLLDIKSIGSTPTALPSGTIVPPMVIGGVALSGSSD